MKSEQTLFVQTFLSHYYDLFTICALRAPVAQWVKRWPTNLAVPSSIPARGRLFSTANGVYIAHSFSLSTSHCPDMTEILLKKDVKSQVIHPYHICIKAVQTLQHKIESCRIFVLKFSYAMACPPVRETIHSLKLVDYLLVHAHGKL